MTFLEYWKRYSVSLAHRWDVGDVEREEMRPRPEFALKAPSIQENPVTGIPEPAFPSTIRRKRIIAGVGFVLLMVPFISCYLCTSYLNAIFYVATFLPVGFYGYHLHSSCNYL